VLGDRGYDAEAIRRGLRERGIVPLLAMRNTEHVSGLGRWVVERTFAWLNQFRRLRVRYLEGRSLCSQNGLTRMKKKWSSK
jgi:transposase